MSNYYPHNLVRFSETYETPTEFARVLGLVYGDLDPLDKQILDRVYNFLYHTYSDYDSVYKSKQEFDLAWEGWWADIKLKLALTNIATINLDYTETGQERDTRTLYATPKVLDSDGNPILDSDGNPTYSKTQIGVEDFDKNNIENSTSNSDKLRKGPNIYRILHTMFNVHFDMISLEYFDWDECGDENE